MTDVLYKDLSYEIMSAVFEVHNTLGVGFLEKVYENALSKELALRGLKVETQQEIRIFYKDEDVGLSFADLLVNGKILIELRAVESLNNLHKAQILNYLKATGLKLGLLINFGKERVESKRFVV